MIIFTYLNYTDSINNRGKIMKKFLSIFFAFAMMLSLAFFSELISSSNPLSVQAQTNRGNVRVRRKNRGLASTTYRGGKYVYRKAKNGTIYVYRKTKQGTVYVGKKTYQGGKYVTRKTVKGTKAVVSRTKKILN